MRSSAQECIFMMEHHQVFQIEHDGRTLIVIPQGDDSEFRYERIHTEANAVIRMLDDSENQNLVIDLVHVDHANSIIIGSFVRMARKLTDRGCQAVFCCASRKTLQVLKTMNLIQVWPHYSTRAEALQSLTD